jgi:hypothetical protein
VDDINGGSIAWLRPDPFSKSHGIRIPAGVPFDSFMELVHLAGGHVFVAVLRP